MNLKVATDIVRISRIKLLSRAAKSKVFHKSEFGTPEHMAGIFAAKECCKKIFGAKMDWKAAEVKKMKAGGPKVILLPKYENRAESLSLSISHEGDYAIAFLAAVLKP